MQEGSSPSAGVNRPGHDWLSGGGEMGARIRAFDWASTPLGPVQHWPQTLRALVSVMLQSEQAMFIAWGPSRTVLYNDGYAPMCGDKHPWALGRPFDTIWADIIESVGPIMDRAYAGSPTYMDDITFTMTDRYGYPEETHFSFSYTPVRSEDGQVAGMFCACAETTDRVFADRRLQFLVELNDRLRPLSEPKEIMAVAAEALGRRLQVGRAGYGEVVDQGTHLVVERDWTDGVMPTLAGRTRLADFGSDIVRDYETGHTVRVDDAATDSRTRESVSSFDAVSVRSGIGVPLVRDGRFVAALYVHQATPRRWRRDEEMLVRDVLERTWDAVERARSEQRLREEDRRKDEFLATLAHELRNPLAPLRTGVEILKRSGDPDPAARRVHAMMERQVGHMARLIDDLLDVSRVSRGLIELRRRRIDLRDVLNSAVETSLPLMEAAHHELSLHFPEDPLLVDGDPVRLAQAIGNLLNNAAKYTPHQGRVELTAERDGALAILRVTDNGIGIPEEMLDRVFDMFTQVHERTERSQGGLGVGLTLVRRLVEMHGGTVSAESSGRGSTFTVRLPLAMPQAATERDEHARSTPSTGASSGVPLRVLVVDDNHDAVEMLSMLIHSHGHAPMAAHSGHEALLRVESAAPDVVFLDIGLPDLDGYEVARRIRQKQGDRRTLLVALTGWGSEEDRRRAHEAGFDAHVTKPPTPEALESLLASAAAGRAGKRAYRRSSA